MADDVVTEALTEAITGPAEVSSDAGTVKQHSLADLIAAHKYLSGATSKANRGIRFSKLVPGDTLNSPANSRDV